MKFCTKGPDGGKKSNVTGFWVLEVKGLCSIVFLKFNKGSREVYHSHAFNALTWWLKGEVVEHLLDGIRKTWTPSLRPKYTPRHCVHKVYGIKDTYAISFRGPWARTWQEYSNPNTPPTTLAWGRKEVLP